MASNHAFNALGTQAYTAKLRDCGVATVNESASSPRAAGGGVSGDESLAAQHAVAAGVSASADTDHGAVGGSMGTNVVATPIAQTQRLEDPQSADSSGGGGGGGGGTTTLSAVATVEASVHTAAEAARDDGSQAAVDAGGAVGGGDGTPGTAASGGSGGTAPAAGARLVDSAVDTPGSGRKSKRSKRVTAARTTGRDQAGGGGSIGSGGGSGTALQARKPPPRQPSADQVVLVCDSDRAVAMPAGAAASRVGTGSAVSELGEAGDAAEAGEAASVSTSRKGTQAEADLPTPAPGSVGAVGAAGAAGATFGSSPAHKGRGFAKVCGRCGKGRRFDRNVRHNWCPTCKKAHVIWMPATCHRSASMGSEVTGGGPSADVGYLPFAEALDYARASSMTCEQDWTAWRETGDRHVQHWWHQSRRDGG